MKRITLGFPKIMMGLLISSEFLLAGMKPYINGGTLVEKGRLEAVGTIPGCTATLITQDTVITAAHCVCQIGLQHRCNSRATFTLHSVQPVNGLSRKNISISGNVYVHPNFDGRKDEICKSKNVDIAVIHLDTPVYKIAKVEPIAIEERFNIPQKSEVMVLIGYGLTGNGKVFGKVPNTYRECRDPSKGKMQLILPVASISSDALYFNKKNKHTCGGDSGGPILNSKGKVVATASCSDRSRSSHYEPLYPFYEWIFGLNKQSENGICRWNNLQKAGINSHQKGASWCSSGTLLTALDLDGGQKFSATDSPTVGAARCCNTGRNFLSSSWVRVLRSHQKGSAWCSQGSFITALDLDGGKAAYDYPVVGAAQCSKISNKWGKCLWVEVGAVRSHQSWSNWCPAGTYLTALDLDSVTKLDAHDSPVIGRAMCCSIGK